MDTFQIMKESVFHAENKECVPCGVSLRTEHIIALARSGRSIESLAREFEASVAMIHAQALTAGTPHFPIESLCVRVFASPAIRQTTPDRLVADQPLSCAACALLALSDTLLRSVSIILALTYNWNTGRFPCCNEGRRTRKKYNDLAKCSYRFLSSPGHHEGHRKSAWKRGPGLQMEGTVTGSFEPETARRSSGRLTA